MVARRKIVLIIVSLVAISSGALAQQTAITKDGREVILYPDGRWAYRGEASSSVQTKPLAAKKTFKGKSGFYGLSVDDTKWVQKKPTIEGHEFYFVHSDGDIYAFTIPERIEFPIEALRDVIIQNAKDGGLENPKVAQEEKRIINGKQVSFLLTEGLYHGVPMVFAYYLYSGGAGTVQIVVTTSRNLFPQYKNDITDLLNGLEIYK